MGGLHAPDNFVGLVGRVGQHFCHPLLGRQNDRQIIGPVIILEYLVQLVLAGRVHKARRGAREGAVGIGGLVLGQALDHLLHERTPGDRIVAIHIGAQLGGTFAHHRLRHKRMRRFRQALHLADGFDHVVKDIRMQRHGGDAVFGF